MEKKVDLYGNVDFFFIHNYTAWLKMFNKKKETLVKLFSPRYCHFVCIFVSETHLVMISDGRLHVHYFNHGFLFIFLLFFPLHAGLFSLFKALIFTPGHRLPSSLHLILFPHLPVQKLTPFCFR